MSPKFGIGSNERVAPLRSFLISYYTLFTVNKFGTVVSQNWDSLNILGDKIPDLGFINLLKSQIWDGSVPELGFPDLGFIKY